MGVYIVCLRGIMCWHRLFVIAGPVPWAQDYSVVFPSLTLHGKVTRIPLTSVENKFGTIINFRIAINWFMHSNTEIVITHLSSVILV